MHSYILILILLPMLLLKCYLHIYT